MAEEIAVLIVNLVDGCGLFQYLETFFKDGTSYKVFAVTDSREIRTDSGIVLTVDDAVANLRGHEDEYNALMSACGDVVPVFQQNTGKPYGVTMLGIIKTLGEKGKTTVGHCAAATMLDFMGITKGKEIAVHPSVKPAIRNGEATDNPSEIDGNFHTVWDENNIQTIIEEVVATLKA